MIAAARESLDHQWCQRVGFHFLDRRDWYFFSHNATLPAVPERHRRVAIVRPRGFQTTLFQGFNLSPQL